MAWKGTYNSGTTYQNGDEVSYEISNVDRFFIYINAASGSGHAPSDNAYWAEASLVIYNVDDTILKLLIVDDNSYRIRQIMGEHQLVLYFSTPTHTEIPVGSYVMYQATKYILERPEALIMQHSRYFEYTVTLEAYQNRAKRWKFRNSVDGRLQFPLTATAREHLQMFIDNLNRRDTGWTIGECVQSSEKLISYAHAYCLEALQQMASEFETEYEIVGKQVSLHKVEYNKATPLALQYGKGNGFKPSVGRINSGDQMPVEILYVQGSDQNLDPSTYGNKTLLLPAGQQIGYDGAHFSDEQGYDSSQARQYIASADGMSLQRQDRALSSMQEDSLDCTGIYPQRIGTISQVIVVDADDNFYDFTDLNTQSDPCPNYENYLIEGETMTVHFQTGMLAGREFEVKYAHNAITERGSQKLARRFEIIPQDIDGVTMPNNTFKPIAGDTYVVLYCAMPQAYICDNQSKSGASWRMFREAVKYLYENEDVKFSFSGTLDGLWAKQDWVNIGAKIKLGGYIQFTDPRFQVDPIKVRITTIKDYVNNPHSPEITLSNEVTAQGFAGEVKNIEADTDVIPDDNYRRTIAFTKRRFRDAIETTKMLEESLISGYTQSITPISAHLLQMLVGDESLQFGFFQVSGSTYTAVSPTFAYSESTGQFSITLGTSAQSFIIRHYTLGIDSLKASHQISEYKQWNISYLYESAVLDEPAKKYYVYAKCSKTTTTAAFILSETAIALEAQAGYYHLLVGMLNSEYDGTRSFSQMYGFTEITGGRVTTEKIVSDDGNSYLDLVANIFKLGNKLSYNLNSDGKLVLKGAFIQTGSGSETAIGAWCGVYDNSRTYAIGDEVSYTVNSITRSYRYIYATATSGHAPTDTAYWEVTGTGGSAGQNGYNTATIQLYKRSATQAYIDWRDSITYTFETGALDITPEGWSRSVPADDGNPLYVTAASAISRNATHTIAYYEFAVPVKLTQDGANGVNGTDGVDGTDGVSIVWQGTFSSHPSNPQEGWAYYNSTDKKSYTYRSGTWYQMTIDGTNGQDGADGLSIVWKGDSSNPPANPQKNWCYRDTDNGRVYIYNGSAWELMVLDGSDGEDGADGTDGLSVYITYHNNPIDTPPSTPTGAGTTGGWHTNATSASNWMSQKVASSASTGTWGTPIQIKGDAGEDGTNGTDGYNTATVFLFKRSASAIGEITKPAENLTYTFSTGVLSGNLNGWSQSVPASDGNPCYVIQATALSRTNTDSILYTEWSPVKEFVRDGEDGTSEVIVYKNSATAPATPTGTAVPPTGWRLDKQAALSTLVVTSIAKSAEAATSHFDLIMVGDAYRIKCNDSQYLADFKGYAQINFTTSRANEEITISMRASSESRWDCGFVGLLDSETHPDKDNSSTYKLKVTGDGVNGLVTIPIAEAGTHFIRVWYIKDGTRDYYDDCVYFSVLDFQGGKLWQSTGSVQRGAATSWSAPTEVTQDPPLLFQGEYENNRLYYGNSTRRDVVRYEGVYYVANRTAGTFVNILPTNTNFWSNFGGSFESVATGLLFAERAVIENAVVKYLQTQESQRRIEVFGNVMNMYDDLNNVRLNIEGREINASSPTVTYPITPLRDYRRHRVEGTGSYSNTFEMVSFYCAAGATLTIPQLLAKAEMFLEVQSTCSGSVVFKLMDSIDNVIATLGTLTFNSADATLTINSSVRTISTTGTYRIIAVENYTYNNPTGTSTAEILLTCDVSTAGSTIVVGSDTRQISIGSNGMVINLGGSCYAAFVDNNGSPSILLQALSSGSVVGLKIDSTGVWKKQSTDTSWRQL